ncbi:MAG: tetratricopeptide repeat protein [Burkholderiales bacterium]|nr:tetratricopeptide repeat protein [Burkholderiales bacterium]ODU71571.1 MAG: hypothetical protein ABT05_01050 [Lautropia sp. SCN 66-9]
MSNPDALFRRAVELHRQGDLAQARALYQQVLELRPEHPAVLNCLGQAQLAQGQVPQAVETLQRAVRAAPGYADACVSLGNALLTAEQPERALDAFKRATSLKPATVAGWIGCGNALQRLERFVEAVPMMETASTLAPQEPAAWLGLANALLGAGQTAQALERLAQVEALQPEWPPAMLTRARALVELQQAPEALAVIDELQKREPRMREALFVRVQALEALGQRQALIQALDGWLQGHPDDPDAHNALGLSLEADEQLGAAAEHFERATAARPAWAIAGVNHARVLRKLGQFDAARAQLAAVLSRDPRHMAAVAEQVALAEAQDDPVRMNNWLQRARQAVTEEQDDGAIARLATAAAHQCRWEPHDDIAARLRAQIETDSGETPPFTVLSWFDDPALQHRAARAYARRHFKPAAAPMLRAAPGRRLRIAYVSSDFYDHATMYLAARLFELHDRERFEVWGISIGPAHSDAMRQRAERAFEHFIDLGESATAETVERLRSLELDLAIDLKGYTGRAGTALFAARIAPIQVNFLGYPGTMGADFIDYIIADPTVIARDQIEHFTERVVWLPDSYQPNDDTRAPASVSITRADVGLPADAFVLCCFNNAYKLKAGTFESWMRVLAGVSDAVLWLWVTDPQAQAHLRDFARARGIDGERLVFAESWQHHRHLARLRLADLFVDTLPYNAHTTTADALWSGLPVVTQLGHTFAGRVAASLLRSAGLSELVTDSPRAYETLILALANDRPRLAELRTRLETSRSTAPLFDSLRFARHLEAAFEGIISDRRQGLHRGLRVIPDSSSVQPIE